MFCLPPGSVMPLAVDPTCFYDTLNFVENFDLIYWISVFTQTMIEACLGFFMRQFRSLFWFLGMNLFLLDTFLAVSGPFEMHIHELISTMTGQLQGRVQEAFQTYHRRLATQTTLSSIAVGAFLDVLQLRLSRVPVLILRCTLLLVEDVKVVCAAAACSALKVLEDPLAQLEEGYMATYNRHKSQMPVEVNETRKSGVALATVQEQDTVVCDGERNNGVSSETASA